MIRLNLSSKIALLTALLLAIFGTTMLVTFAILSARQTDRTIEADATAAKMQLNLFLGERSSTLRKQAHFAVEGIPRIRALFFLGDAVTIVKEIPQLEKQFSVDGVQIVDPDGNPLGETPELTRLGTNARKQTLEALKTGSELSSIVQGGREIYLMATVPIKSGEFVKGAISLFERIGAQQAKSLAQKMGDELGLIVGGHVVASSIDASYSLPNAMGKPMNILLNDEPYVSIWEALPGADKSEQLGFVILRPTRSITAPYVEARGAFVSVLALSLILSIAGAIVVGRGIARPISSLADAARVIQAGEWPEIFDVRRQDEIGLLQSSFNGMIKATKLAQERLMAMIDMDPLTELRNHRSFRERLTEEARRCDSAETIMTLALIDIDGFDHFNDANGRAKGDEILRQVADTIRTCVPEFSVLARYAGDQFAALLPNTDADSIAVIINFLRVRLQQDRCPITISAGGSEYPKNSSREDGLILASELALERAKQLGRNRVCLFNAVPGADQATDPFLLYNSLENGSFATIQALAAAVEAKDTYTNGHSERVARYASRLSVALGDSPETVDRVFRCGTLHDVGKIGVPDAILKKTGPLEPEEHLVMQTHSVLGELIAGKVPKLADLLPGVRSHHERWDGKGYPDGLVGEQIPYVARILAVADTYDAMTSDRPYRKGLSHTIAIAEIEKSAGSQFDPKIADAFVKMHREESPLSTSPEASIVQ